MKEFRLVAIGFVLGVATSLAAVVVHDAGAPATDTQKAVDVAKHTRAAAVETVTVVSREVLPARAESDRLAELVRVVGPTTLAIRVTPDAAPQLQEVHPSVIAKMRADSTLIARQARQILALQLLVVADSNVIRTQDLRIRELERGQRCGRKCGIVIGVIGTAGLALVLDQVQQLVKD